MEWITLELIIKSFLLVIFTLIGICVLGLVVAAFMALKGESYLPDIDDLDDPDDQDGIQKELMLMDDPICSKHHF